MNQLKLPKYTGAVVYCIENKRSHKKYIGSTLNFRNRIYTHMSELKKGHHNSKEMQSDYENGDCFDVYELYRPVQQEEIKKDIREKESLYIVENNAVENGYNKIAFKVYDDNDTKNENNRNSPAKIAANNRYTAKNYDRINLAVPKGQKRVIERYAAERGQSVNAYIKEAIAEKMEREGNTPE